MFQIKRLQASNEWKVETDETLFIWLRLSKGCPFSDRVEHLMIETNKKKHTCTEITKPKITALGDNNKACPICSMLWRGGKKCAIKM